MRIQREGGRETTNDVSWYMDHPTKSEEGQEPDESDLKCSTEESKVENNGSMGILIQARKKTVAERSFRTLKSESSSSDNSNNITSQETVNTWREGLKGLLELLDSCAEAEVQATRLGINGSDNSDVTRCKPLLSLKA
ncbi:hypothetical protein CDL15_Pgr005341 [Punica granatum]|uniref:Uncharacterized protein n=1 Tax=Punica granatum TaxID=22663 RepID=A0A218XEN7_PUNGR|nr:hypothetical protein CDL15_Pgr005341 [Punica granatum]PKI37760.1 hypothetical protein CRG98_041841 [Punica granatum]